MAEISVETPAKLQQTTGSNEMARDIRFKHLTEKYGLQSGAEISLKKINIDPKYHSDIKPGDELKGSIRDDIRRGRPLVLYDNGNFVGNTSGIVNIREVDEKLQILTESHSIYEITVKKPEISVEDKFKKLTEKYGIHQGSEISIKKVEIDQNVESDVKVGMVLSGTISEEFGLGKSLVFTNEGRFIGNTSGVVDIKEKDGRLQFLTRSNSVYEVISKKATMIEEIIRNNFEQQPKTTKDIIENHKDLFVTKKKIDNKIWVFTANYGGEVMALVNSDEQPDVFHPRFFRVSGSDHQFKAYPGIRDDGYSIAKGNEDNENHHYVQSAKLDRRIILALQELPKENGYYKQEMIMNYLPVMRNKKDINDSGKNLEDFNFSEEQIRFKNEDWQKIKEEQKKMLDLYEYLNHHIDRKNAKNFHNLLISWANYLDINTEKLSETVRAITNKNDEWKVSDILSSNDPQLAAYKNELISVAQKTTEEIFKNKNLEDLMTRSNFIPDFRQKATESYIKTDGQKKIRVEVFINKSPEGDTLCWEMATDEKGRTYIDNIYDPTVGIDSYGTPKKKTNMGILIYKPEDYDSQIAFVPKKYTRNLEDYVDISRLLELSKPVRMYKEKSNLK